MRMILRFVRFVLALGLGALGAAGAFWVGHAILAPRAPALFRGDASAEREVALGTVSWGPTTHDDFGTGTELFDREWTFGTPMMRAACLGQILVRNPVLDAELGPHLDDAVKELLSEKSRAFTKLQWGSDPLSSKDDRHAHAAYLGYTGFALGIAARAHPDRWTESRRDVVGRLRSRVLAREEGVLETYPGQAYPPDLSAVAGALALDRDDVRDADPALDRALGWVEAALDPSSGLLVQAVSPASGEAVDRPRGSGTFLAAYFLVPADDGLARRLYERGQGLAGKGLLFMAMREHLPGGAGGDVDSGPLVFGFGVSATGFALGGARAFGDERTFLEISKTASLFGVPYRQDRGVRHIAGGPLGDAILCAMQTALTPDEWARDRSGGPP